MSQTILFPDDDFRGPPKKKRSVMDEIIDNIFQVLPAESAKEITERLVTRGININVMGTRYTLQHLRVNAEMYQWTVPHVSSAVSGDFKYFPLLMEKDGSFHSDPMFMAALANGTTYMVKRMSTESQNQCMMLRAAANATHLRANIRQEFRDMADECASIHNKAKRVLRYLNTANG